MTDRPLEGVRILDLTRLLPGAYATLMLADLGADVIKIEDPNGGDTMRALPVRAGAPRYFDLLNRGKRSVTLNLRSVNAAPVLDRLLATADVVIDSFRPAAARRLGVDAETVRRRHPALIAASITGFGSSGPLANTAGHDINFQALAGLLRPPALPGPLVVDVGAAMQAVIAVLAALVARAATGTGATLDLSMRAAAAEWSLFPTTADLASPCYGLYQAGDGRWLALGALEAKFWRAFCERIGRPDLVGGQRARGTDAERVMSEIRAVIRTRTAAEWAAHFAGVDACLTEVADPASGGDAPEPGPLLGADTAAVLSAIGIDDAQTGALRSSGVI